MSKRNEIVEIARSQIGYQEGYNNDTKYGEWYGLNHEPWCFKAGTLILTPNGEKNIENIKIGDKVISADGTINEVYNNNKRKVEEIITIKVNGNIPIDTTKEHPFLCQKRNKNKFMSATYIPAEKIEKGDRIALFKGKFGNKKIDLGLAYLIGRFIGDGWVTIHHNRKEFFICCSYEETEELEKRMNEAKISYTKDKHKRTCQQYSIHKTNNKGKNLNNELFADILFNIKTGAKNKKVPDDVWNWNKESTKAFLDGYLDADGSDKSDLLINFTTISKELLIGVSNLFRKFGYNINCAIRHRNESVICGRKVNSNDTYWGYCTGRKSNFYEDDGDYIWVLVKDIKTKKEKVNVYNLSVKDTHTFIANGFVVHNCAMFVSWCGNQIGVLDKAFPRFAGCTTGFHEMQTWGITTNEHIIPETGDLIFFEWDGDYDDYDHVGIVESADENWVNTIEGNHEDCVARYTYQRNSRCIVGYAKPNYEGVKPEPRPEPVQNEIKDFQHWLNQFEGVVIDEDGIFGKWTKKACVIVLQELLNQDYGLSIAVDGIWGNETWNACHNVCLTKGDVRQMVQLVQGLLVCYGYNTNGIDGIFGDGTYQAVMNYQANHGLTTDGMVGVSTLSLMFS